MPASEGAIHHPAGIQLDVGAGKMYWVDSGQLKLGVHRVNLDGTGHEWLIDLLSLRKNSGQTILKETSMLPALMDLPKALPPVSDKFYPGFLVHGDN